MILTTRFALPRIGAGGNHFAAAVDTVPQVEFVFAPSWAKPLPNPKIGLVRGESANRLLWLPTGAVHVDVPSMEERPELAKILVGPPADREAFVPKDGACTQDSSSFWISRDPAVTQGFSEEDYVDFLSAEFGRNRGAALTRYRRFFYEIDRRAEPALRSGLSPSECTDLSRNIDSNGAFYAVRASFLARMQCCTRLLPYPGGRWNFFAQEVAYVAAMFERHARTCFPHPALGIDLDEMEDAIEMFANGELRFRISGPEVWCTQPSSGSYHLFGELALLVLEQRPLDPIWSRLAKVFVRTQRLHARAYAPTGVPPAKGWTRFDYVACNYSPEKAATGREKARLRAEYADFSFEALSLAAAHHARSCFPGELT